MSSYTVAILGATGAVGREMLRMLQTRHFPVERLIALSGTKSAGSSLVFGSEEIPVLQACDEAFLGADLVLGAASNAVVRQFAPAIARSGAILVDNSSAFRLHPQVPLIIPEINPQEAANHHGILSNPNCTTIITLTAIAPLLGLGKLKSMVVSSYQAVSGAGAGGPLELQQQVSSLCHGKPLPPKIFPHPIAYNLIPQIGAPDYQGYTSEEMKLQNEGRKILNLPELTASCTCVRVPVVRSHSVSVQLCFDRPVAVEDARACIANAPGCKLVDDLQKGEYPMPLMASDQDLVYVGRIRPDLTDENRLNLWCCGDQIRKGAATNAIQIAELLFSA